LQVTHVKFKGGDGGEVVANRPDVRIADDIEILDVVLTALTDAFVVVVVTARRRRPCLVFFDADADDFAVVPGVAAFLFTFLTAAAGFFGSRDGL